MIWLSASRLTQISMQIRRSLAFLLVLSSLSFAPSTHMLPRSQAAPVETLAMSTLSSGCLTPWNNVAKNISYGNMFIVGNTSNIVKFQLRNTSSGWESSSIDFFSYDANSASKMSSKLATFSPTT